MKFYSDEEPEREFGMGYATTTAEPCKPLTKKERKALKAKQPIGFVHFGKKGGGA